MASGGVERFRRLMELLVTEAPITVSEAAAGARLPVSTAHKALKEFASCGLANFDPDRRVYGPGTELYRLFALLAQSGPLTAGVRQILGELAAAAGETACLNWLNRDRGSYTVLAVEEGTRALQYVVEPGGNLPLHAGASGRAILASMDAAEIRKYLNRRKVARLTAETIVDSRLLQEALQATRKNGFAVSQGERLVGAIGIAAPIFDAKEQVVGSLQLTIPEQRYRKRMLRPLAKLVKEHAARLRGYVDGVL